MSDDELRELYQTTILDHNKQPRNFRVPEGANREARGNNPLCGDQLTVYVRLEDGVVRGRRRSRARAARSRRRRRRS